MLEVAHHGAHADHHLVVDVAAAVDVQVRDARQTRHAVLAAQTGDHGERTDAVTRRYVDRLERPQSVETTHGAVAEAAAAGEVETPQMAEVVADGVERPIAELRALANVEPNDTRHLRTHVHHSFVRHLPAAHQMELSQLQVDNVSEHPKPDVVDRRPTQIQTRQL